MKRDPRDNPRVRGVWPAFAEPKQPADHSALIIALCLIVLSLALLLSLL